MGFELTYYEDALKIVNLYITESSPHYKLNRKELNNKAPTYLGSTGRVFLFVMKYFKEQKWMRILQMKKKDFDIGLTG